jgi:type I restriction enzyme S subunit
VSWGAEFPTEWPRTRIKHVCRFAGGGTPDKGTSEYWNGDIPWVSPKDMKSSTINDTEDHITLQGLESSATKLVAPGAVLLVMRSGILRHSIPVAINRVPVALNQDMRAMTPVPRIDARYLARLLEGHQQQLLNAWCKVGSTVESLESDLVGDTEIAVPPLSKQRAIADYLDRETARLDALVAAKERVLGLLAEKRRALITRAVTRGLDPRAPLRDSGIPWLGKIPAHWDLKRIKHVGRAIIGLTFDPADTVTDGSGVLVLRASNVRDQKIVLDDNLFVLMDIPETLRTREGDILICSRSGSRALIGKNALIDQASAGLTFGTFMTVLRSPHNEYLFYIFNSPLFDYQAGAFSTSTINQLTVETLNGMEVPLPPPSEQKAIVAGLRDSTSRLDRLVEATNRTITLLKERRAALIAAAVTGEIDVESAA